MNGNDRRLLCDKLHAALSNPAEVGTPRWSERDRENYRIAHEFLVMFEVAHAAHAKSAVAEWAAMKARDSDPDAFTVQMISAFRDALKRQGIPSPRADTPPTKAQEMEGGLLAISRRRAVETIEKRIAELDDIHANYLAYQQRRVAERDHHCAWDVAINLAETEAEQAGLRFALAALVAK